MRTVTLSSLVLGLLASLFTAFGQIEESPEAPPTPDDIADAVDAYSLRHRTIAGCGYVITRYAEWWRQRVAGSDLVAPGYHFDPTDFLVFAFAIDRAEVRWDVTVRATETSGFHPVLPTSVSLGKSPAVREEQIHSPWAHSYCDGERIVTQLSDRMATRVSPLTWRGAPGGGAATILDRLGIFSLPGQIEWLRDAEIVGEEIVSDEVTHHVQRSREDSREEAILRSQAHLWVAADGCPMRCTSMAWLRTGEIAVDAWIVRQRGIVPTVTDVYHYSYSDDPDQPTPWAWSMQFGFHDLAFDERVNWEQRSLVPCIGAHLEDEIWREMPWDINVLDEIYDLYRAGGIAVPGPDADLFPAGTKREFESRL